MKELLRFWVVAGGALLAEPGSPLQAQAQQFEPGTSVTLDSDQAELFGQSWRRYVGGGYQNDLHYADADADPTNGSDIIRYTFYVEPGDYLVSTTWLKHWNRATDAPFTIKDGSSEINTIDVNQEESPNDFAEQGVWWDNLGVFTITGNALLVELSNDADDHVIADAVRIFRVDGIHTEPGVAKYADSNAVHREGAWHYFHGIAGYGNDVWFTSAGTGTAYTEWTFYVSPGDYQVSTTWARHPNRATNAPFTSFDDQAIIDTVSVNQENAPDDFPDKGIWWENLGGTIPVTGNILKVRVSDLANEFVIADAIRVVRMDGIQTRPAIGAPPANPYAIRFSTPQGLQQARDNAIHYLWKGAGFPYNKQPTSVSTNVGRPTWITSSNFGEMDKLVIDMAGGFQSTVYHFRAKPSNDRLAIFHQGHANRLSQHGGNNTINYLLNQGFDVLGIYMPLWGPNKKGSLSHNGLAALESPQLAPMKYFLEPVAVALNHTDVNYSYIDEMMTGVSGGGWATVVYSALDTRIDISIPVGGAIPIDLRVAPEDQGDYEQRSPDFYDIVNYRELFVMGAYDPNGQRQQLQIFNYYDTCCFAGAPYVNYQDDIQNALSNLGLNGSEVSYYSDTSFLGHAISVTALDQAFPTVLGSQ